MFQNASSFTQSSKLNFSCIAPCAVKHLRWLFHNLVFAALSRNLGNIVIISQIIYFHLLFWFQIHRTHIKLKQSKKNVNIEESTITETNELIQSELLASNFQLLQEKPKLLPKFRISTFRGDQIIETWMKMPTQVMNDSNSGNTEIKVKTAYNGEIMITYINENISYTELCNEIRGICRFSPDQVTKKTQHSDCIWIVTWNWWIVAMQIKINTTMELYGCNRHKYFNSN